MRSPDNVRFKTGRRFGRSFRVSVSATGAEPAANGTWTTTSRDELKFDACPRGGRDVKGC